LIAIINLSDIDHHIRASFQCFKKAAMISVSKYASLYILNTVFVDNHQNIGLLLFLFSFSILELITVLPAFKNLFEGLLHLGMMNEGTAVYLKKIKRKKARDRSTGKTVIYRIESKKNVTEKIYSLTSFFIVLHRFATALPEFTTLISKEANKYEFIRLLRWFGILLVLPVGIAWLIKIIVYCVRIRKDKVFIENLSNKYLSKAEINSELYILRPISTGLAVMTAAFALSIDFYSGYSNLLPDFLFYTGLCLGALILRKYSKKWLGLLLVSTVGIASSAFVHFYSEYFHSVFYPGAIRKNIHAYYSYYTMFGMHIADAVVMLIAVLFAILVLWDICKSHTELADYSNRKVFKDSMPYVRGIIAVSVFSLFAAVGSVYFVWAQPFKFYEGWYFYYATVISVVLGVLFAIIAAYFTVYINSAVKFKYKNPEFE